MERNDRVTHSHRIAHGKRPVKREAACSDVKIARMNGWPAITYTDTTLTRIKAVHLTDLRAGVQ
jgi:hypothetical protein